VYCPEDNPQPARREVTQSEGSTGSPEVVCRAGVGLHGGGSSGLPPDCQAKYQAGGKVYQAPRMGSLPEIRL